MVEKQTLAFSALSIKTQLSFEKKEGELDLFDEGNGSENHWAAIAGKGSQEIQSDIRIVIPKTSSASFVEILLKKNNRRIEKDRVVVKHFFERLTTL